MHPRPAVPRSIYVLGGRLLASVVAVLAKDAAPAVGAVPDGESGGAASKRIAVEKDKKAKWNAANKKERHQKLMTKNPKLTESDLNAAEAAVEKLAVRSCPKGTGTAGPADLKFRVIFLVVDAVSVWV